MDSRGSGSSPTLRVGWRWTGVQRFTDLEVWQRGHKYLLALYEVAKRMPHDERYVLSAQLRSAALSVTGNIAEGSRRAQPADYARFLNYAQASLSELESHLMAARDLGYVPRDRAEALIDEAQQ